MNKRKEAEAAEAKARKERAEADAAERQAAKERAEAEAAEAEAEAAARAEKSQNNTNKEKPMGKSKNKGGGDKPAPTPKTRTYYRFAFRKDTLFKGEHVPAGKQVVTENRQEAYDAMGVTFCLYVQKVDVNGAKKTRTDLHKARDTRIPPEPKSKQDSEDAGEGDGEEDSSEE